MKTRDDLFAVFEAAFAGSGPTPAQVQAIEQAATLLDWLCAVAMVPDAVRALAQDNPKANASWELALAAVTLLSVKEAVVAFAKKNQHLPPPNTQISQPHQQSVQHPSQLPSKPPMYGPYSFATLPDHMRPPVGEQPMPAPSFRVVKPPAFSDEAHQLITDELKRRNCVQHAIAVAVASDTWHALQPHEQQSINVAQLVDKVQMENPAMFARGPAATPSPPPTPQPRA